MLVHASELSSGRLWCLEERNSLPGCGGRALCPHLTSSHTPFFQIPLIVVTRDSMLDTSYPTDPLLRVRSVTEIGPAARNLSRTFRSCAYSLLTQYPRGAVSLLSICFSACFRSPSPLREGSRLFSTSRPHCAYDTHGLVAAPTPAAALLSR